MLTQFYFGEFSKKEFFNSLLTMSISIVDKGVLRSKGWLPIPCGLV